jgi:hypothetical protein
MSVVRTGRRLAIGGLMACAAGAAHAELMRIDVISQSDVPADTASAGRPAYEKIVGRAIFSLDPADAHNKIIVDLDKAPRDPDGRVTFSSELEVLTPKDRARGNDAALFDIVNRGRRQTDDAFLMKHGYTIVRVGWQFDTARGDLIGVEAPPVLENGKPVTGRVSTLFTPNTSDPVHALDDLVKYADLTQYPPVDPNSKLNTLFVRNSYLAEAHALPRDAWQFGRMKDGKLVPDTSAIYLKGGFAPGQVYELSYEAKGAVVAGVGFAALRDMASAVKHGKAGAISARYAYALGNSQDGRMLREFLYEGFNADEGGQRAFDGIIANIAGSARSADFNVHFARPNGLAFFSASLFPYLDFDQKDPVTGRVDGVQMHLAPDMRPKIFYTNSSTEYWGGGRAAALVHTTLDGSADVKEPENVRIYLFAGTQHVPGGYLASQGPGTQKPNGNNYGWAMHALIEAMDRWVKSGVAPPESAHPKLADGTLVPLTKIGFPKIAGVKSPLSIPAGYRADLEGPHGAHPLPMLVPQVDKDGNEMSGIRLPNVAAPLGSYTGWNFRDPSIGQPDELLPLTGSFVAFAVTKAEREANNDPRLSLEERYGTRERYRAQASAAAEQLVQERFVLREDVPRIVQQAMANWDNTVRGTALAGK